MRVVESEILTLTTMDSILTLNQLQALRQSISSHLPFISGVLPVSNPEDLALYYGKGENAR